MVYVTIGYFVTRKEECHASFIGLKNIMRNKMGITTAARSRDFMRKQGFTAECVEHRMGRFIRKDLFNFGDVLVYKPTEGIIIIQAHNETNSSKKEDERHNKFNPRENVRIRDWLLSGGKFELHLWRYRTKKGRKFWSVERRVIE